MKTANAYVIGVGVDTARYGHHVTFLGPTREPAAESLAMPESSAGYALLAERLERLRAKHPAAHFHIRIDAGGQYAANLERFLRGLDAPKTISIGEPKRNKDYHRAVSPKRKSDATESYAMARYAVCEDPQATLETSEAIRALCEVAARLEGQVRSRTQAINRLHNLMSRVFPELATLAPCFGAAWVLQLLKQHATPERIAKARQATLEKIPRVDAAKAQSLQAAAKTSVGSLHGPIAEELVACAVEEVAHCQGACERLETLLLEAFDAIPESGHRQLETIAGVGRITAAVLTAKIVDIGRFETAEKLVGYFGVFPEEWSSGVDKAGQPQICARRMSRKGNDLARRYLFCAAKSAITHNPAARELYARLRDRGTRGDVALGHVMRKLLHQIYGVWTSDKPFDKQHQSRRRGDGQPQTSASEPRVQDAPPADAAQQNGAGRKREVVPVRKAVAAPQSSVGHSASTVNVEQERSAKRVDPFVDFAYVRSQITIEQVLEKLGCRLPLRGAGSEKRGCCPIHESPNKRSRSFSVNVEKNVFQCFRPECAAKGNALDLWAAVRRETPYDAALSLAQACDIRLSPGTEKRST